jgi:toxin-antitoxin system PIN domain toxin
MQALLDINVLLALFDEDHVFHQRAHDWFAENRAAGWTTCPLTENGLVRIRSNPHYHPHVAIHAAAMIEALRTFTASGDHAFWADDLSLLDATRIEAPAVLGTRQITDIYLLALAVKQGGRLATFDQGVNLTAVRGAAPHHLCVI